MERIAFPQFCQDNGITGVSNVRLNANGYPFVTLLGKNFEGGAQNVYFGKKSAAKVVDGQEPKTLGLKDAGIVEVQNEAGEQRLKLSLSQYTDIDDLF